MNGERERVDSRAIRASGLLIGDLLVIVGLVVAGQLSHNMDPTADPLGTVESILPFATGWLVVVGLARIYTGETIESVGQQGTVVQIGSRVTVYWLAAANVAYLLRGSELFHGGVPWSFTVVMAGLGLVALLGWRVVIVEVVLGRVWVA